MKRLRKRGHKTLWLDAPARPYRVAAPVAGEVFVCALFVADPAISESERMASARELVAAGCRYACCAGLDCSKWHDSIDMAYLETDPNLAPPEETFVMTTWHEKDSVADVLAFALDLTDFDDHQFEHVLVLMLGDDPRLLAEIERAVDPRSRTD